MVVAMTEENEDKKPEPPKEGDTDPVADLKHGLGLLLRAAKNAAQGAATRAKDAAQTDKVDRAFKAGIDDLHKAVDRLQSDKLEGALKTSLQEIGRAFGNVAQKLERELRDDDDDEQKKS